jgi:hypothetical protein
MPAGQPTKYRKRYCKDAAKLCTLGATDAKLAEFFEVSESTINLWKETHPEFSESIKEAKANLDAQVERSLHHRAVGYSHPDTHFSQNEGTVIETPTTKYYPPSEVACIFWLKNRQPEKWREKQEIDVSVSSPIEALADALARRKVQGVSK